MDFDKKRYVILFDMRVFAFLDHIMESIASKHAIQRALIYREKAFCNHCSLQNESVKSATVDVHIKFDCKENVPANITANCFILHDCVIEYCPLTNVVRKIM